MAVSLSVSSSSQKEEARFLPRAVDGATEVERFGAITARAARAPAGGRASRSKWQSNPAWMRAGGIQLEQPAAPIRIRFYVVYPTCFFEWTRVGSPPAARRGPVAKTRNSKCPAQGESVRFRMQLECSMMLTY